jgi:hypothetical protein
VLSRGDNHRWSNQENSKLTVLVSRRFQPCQQRATRRRGQRAVGASHVDDWLRSRLHDRVAVVLKIDRHMVVIGVNRRTDADGDAIVEIGFLGRHVNEGTLAVKQDQSRRGDDRVGLRLLNFPKQLLNFIVGDLDRPARRGGSQADFVRKIGFEVR